MLNKEINSKGIDFKNQKKDFYLIKNRNIINEIEKSNRKF